MAAPKSSHSICSASAISTSPPIALALTTFDHAFGTAFRPDDDDDDDEEEDKEEEDADSVVTG